MPGAAHEFNSRACLSGEVDGEGRVDILVEHKDVRNDRSRLFFLQNELESSNAWIGFHLRSDLSNVSPLGAVVTLELPDGRSLKRYNVAGRSVWAQHENSAHFGLGRHTRVTGVTVRWPNGEVTQLNAPEPGRYHVLSPVQNADGNVTGVSGG